MAVNDSLPLTVGRLRQELHAFAEDVLQTKLHAVETSIKQYLLEMLAASDPIDFRHGSILENSYQPNNRFNRGHSWQPGVVHSLDTQRSQQNLSSSSGEELSPYSRFLPRSWRHGSVDASEPQGHQPLMAHSGSMEPGEVTAWVLVRRSPLVLQKATERRRGSLINHSGLHSHTDSHKHSKSLSRFKRGSTGSSSVIIAESDEEHTPMFEIEKPVPKPRTAGAKPASARAKVHRNSTLENDVNYSASGSLLFDIDEREAVEEIIEPEDTEDMPDGWTLQQTVKSQQYEIWNCLLIFVSAVQIGIQTDYMARTWSREVPKWTTLLDHVLLLWFTCDIALRLLVDRCSFFCSTNWVWNLVDLVAVCVQAISTVASYMVIRHRYFEMLRLAKGVRLIRVFRVARQLRAVQGIRSLLVSIEHSLKSLGSVVFIIFLQSFVCGVYLTQIVTDYKIEMGAEQMEKQEELHFFWGSLDRSMLSLYEVLSDGIHWSEIAHPIAEHISPWMMVFFCCYIAFSLVTVMNVVTGVFVDSALTAANEERKEILLEAMVQLFLDLDLDGSGAVSDDEFLTQMETDQMKQFLRDIDLAADDASALFDLLDRDGSGEIGAEDLVAGLMRVTGNAKAFDLAVYMHDHTCRLQYLDTRFDRLERILSKRNSITQPMPHRVSTAQSCL